MQHQLLKQQQVSDWLDSPVTRAYLELIDEHLEANRGGVTQIVLSGKVIRDLGEDLAQLKGQIYTLELLKEVRMFLQERINDEEVQTSKTMLDSED